MSTTIGETKIILTCMMLCSNFDTGIWHLMQFRTLMAHILRCFLLDREHWVSSITY